MITFKVEDKEYKLRKPNSRERRQGRRIYNQEMSECIKEGLWIKAQIPRVAEDLKVWDESDDIRIENIRTEVQDLVDKMDKAPKSKKPSIMKSINKLQTEVNKIQRPLLELYGNTAERHAEILQDDYFLSICILDSGNIPYCKDLDDFYEKEDDPVVIAGYMAYRNYIVGGAVDPSGTE